jgi:prefoldin subunit 2
VKNFIGLSHSRIPSHGRLVIETLEKVDGGRRCYRQMGGTLVARTVAELLPSLRDKLAKMQEAMTNYKLKLSEAGEKLNEYRTKYACFFLKSCFRAETTFDSSTKMKDCRRMNPLQVPMRRRSQLLP